jgi:hypothetical protein
MGVELPLQHRSPQRWAYPRMKEEVRRLAKGRTEWPRQAEFEAAGLDGLYQTIWKTKTRERIAAELGLTVRPPRRGRASPWTDDEIRGVLDQFLAGRRTWPTHSEFRAAGLRILADHITARGKREWWARQYGLEPPAPRLRWTDAAIERALDEFLEGRDRRPTRTQFKHAGLGGSVGQHIPHWHAR